jgi:hypothetical protein
MRLASAPRGRLPSLDLYVCTRYHDRQASSAALRAIVGPMGDPSGPVSRLPVAASLSAARGRLRSVSCPLRRAAHARSVADWLVPESCTDPRLFVALAMISQRRVEAKAAVRGQRAELAEVEKVGRQEDLRVPLMVVRSPALLRSQVRVLRLGQRCPPHSGPYPRLLRRPDCIGRSSRSAVCRGSRVRGRQRAPSQRQCRLAF